MKVNAHCLAAVCLIGACMTMPPLSALAQTPVQKPPAGRSGLDPASRAKVANVLARTQINAEGTRATVDRQLVTGPSGSSCATNIGAPTAPEGTSAIGNRFGSGNNNDQVIVVQGPVINLCK